METIVAPDRAVDRGAIRLSIALAVLHCALFLASLIVVPVMAPGARIANPFGPDEASRNFFLHAAAAIRASAFLQALSAFCLAGLSAALAGVPRARKGSIVGSFLTLAGGGGAAVLLVLTALFSWAIASPGAVDPGPAFRTLQFVPFLAGGPGWAGFFAMFLAGIVMAAGNTLPRWLRGSGYFLAVVSALAPLVLLTIWASPCLPIARFLGFLWLIFAAIRMGRNPAQPIAKGEL